jgi:RNA polymerase sigma factor (sigma-70 family)
MRLAVEHPRRLFDREPGGKLAHQREKSLLIFFHTPEPTHYSPKTEQNFARTLKWIDSPVTGQVAFGGMSDVIKLVKTYRVTTGLAERLRLAEEIFRVIEPDLRFFVFSAVRPPAARDVLQEVLIAITTGMGKFKGDSNEQFWAWCYRIARNKVADHFRKQASDRLQPLPPEELWQLVEASAQASPLSAADRIDLQYALDLLTQSKPECRDLLWQHFVFGLDYAEIAEERNISYDNARMKIGRCLDDAGDLLS